MSTRYIVILDSLCWYLLISVSNLLFQTPQVCSDGVSFLPVSLVCVSLCVHRQHAWAYGACYQCSYGQGHSLSPKLEEV